MKTIPTFFLLFCLISCRKESIEPTSSGDVKISIDFGFPSSGNISAKSASSYLDFYTKYISSKVLTPKTYSINFTGINLHTGFTISGKWATKQLIQLPPDKYEVDGYSWPTKFTACGDTCYLKFKETIDITQVSTSIMLTALYDCSLILLDTTDVKSTNISADTTKWKFYDPFFKAVKTTLRKTDDFHFMFYREGPANGSTVEKTNLDLKITSRQMENVHYPNQTPLYQNKVKYIQLYLFAWEAGKYYYFKNSDSGYNLLPPMTNAND